jgi:hypothetical protein
MPFINLPPSLYQMFDDLKTRILKLEQAQRFTAPNVATDPTNPRKGDIWFNTTSNTWKGYDGTTVRTFTAI